MDNSEPDLIVEIMFADSAKQALGLTSGPPIQTPASSFLERAHLVTAGDFLRLEGVPGLFVVSHRVWVVMRDQATLKLVLDGPVQDAH